MDAMLGGQDGPRGADVDHSPTYLTRYHLPGHKLGANERSVEIRLNDSRPCLIVHVEERLGSVRAGVVAEKVDPGPSAQRFGDQSRGVGALAHVAFDHQGFGSLCLDRSGGLTRAVYLDVGDGHPGALAT